MNHDLYNFIMDKPEIGYNEVNKKKFRKLGQQFLKEVGKLFETHNDLKSKVLYNAGGIAVSGDHTLIVTPKNVTLKGFAVFISEPIGTSCWAMTRTIENLNDHSGGRNIWVGDRFLVAPETFHLWLEKQFNI